MLIPVFWPHHHPDESQGSGGVRGAWSEPPAPKETPHSILPWGSCGYTGLWRSLSWPRSWKSSAEVSRMVLSVCTMVEAKRRSCSRSRMSAMEWKMFSAFSSRHSCLRMVWGSWHGGCDPLTRSQSLTGHTNPRRFVPSRGPLQIHPQPGTPDAS